MAQLEFKAMGCEMLAVIDNDHRLAARHTLAQVPTWFADWEASLSRFRSDSELSQLNRRTGQWVGVSDTLWAVLVVALAAAHQTNGLVNPTLLSAMLAAGYDRSFDELKTSDPQANRPNPAAAIPAAEAWRNIEMRMSDRSVYLPANVALDFGGVAKGWAANQAVQRLSEFGPALVDAGGDVAVSGPRSDGSAWPIAAASPFDDGEQDLELLMINQGAVATSGRDYRRWQQNGVWRHHIIDPRSGQPAATNVLSATVVADDAVTAEVAAKVALILGSSEGMAWIENRPPLAAILSLEDGTIQHSGGIVNYIWR